MCLQRLLRQAKLDQFLLFHELRVRTVVDDIAAKYGDRERAINLLGVDVLKLSVENEFVAIEPEIAGDFPAKECEGEDVTILALGQQREFS